MSQEDTVMLDEPQEMKTEDFLRCRRTALKKLSPAEALTYRKNEIERMLFCGSDCTEVDFTGIDAESLDELLYDGKDHVDLSKRTRYRMKHAENRQQIWKDLQFVCAESYQATDKEVQKKATEVQKMLSMFAEGRMKKDEQIKIDPDPRPDQKTDQHVAYWQEMEKSMQKLMQTPWKLPEDYKKHLIAIQKINKDKGLPLNTGWPDAFGPRYETIHTSLKYYKVAKERNIEDLKKDARERIEIAYKAIEEDCEIWGFPKSWKYPSADPNRAYGPQADSSPATEESAGTTAAPSDAVIKWNNEGGVIVFHAPRQSMQVGPNLPDGGKILAIIRSGKTYSYAIVLVRPDHYAIYSARKMGMRLDNLPEEIPRLGKQVYEKYRERIKKAAVYQGGPAVYSPEGGTYGMGYQGYFVKDTSGKEELLWLSNTEATRIVGKEKAGELKVALQVPDFAANAKKDKSAWMGGSYTGQVVTKSHNYNNPMAITSSHNDNPRPVTGSHNGNPPITTALLTLLCAKLGMEDEAAELIQKIQSSEEAQSSKAINQKPIEASQKPVEASQKPVEASQKPVEASQKPNETSKEIQQRPNETLATQQKTQAPNEKGDNAMDTS